MPSITKNILIVMFLALSIFVYVCALNKIEQGFFSGGIAMSMLCMFLVSVVILMFNMPKYRLNVSFSFFFSVLLFVLGGYLVNFATVIDSREVCGGNKKNISVDVVQTNSMTIKMPDSKNQRLEIMLCQNKKRFLTLTSVLVIALACFVFIRAIMGFVLKQKDSIEITDSAQLRGLYDFVNFSPDGTELFISETHIAIASKIEMYLKKEAIDYKRDFSDSEIFPSFRRIRFVLSEYDQKELIAFLKSTTK